VGRMEGKVVLVTGGLDRIGQSTAALLAKEGGQIFVAGVADTDGSPTHLTRMSHGRQSKNLGGITYLGADVQDEDAWSGMVGGILRRFGRLDLLVYIADTTVVEVDSTPQFPAKVSLEVWPAASGNGSKGSFPGFRHVIKAMLWSGGGSIINIRSNPESGRAPASGAELESGSNDAGAALRVTCEPREVADTVLHLALKQKQQNR
jgi:NAD(P)-dependent dehydrogenase (short-subunit alcohol dehydrogenase family)